MAEDNFVFLHFEQPVTAGRIIGELKDALGPYSINHVYRCSLGDYYDLDFITGLSVGLLPELDSPGIEAMKTELGAWLRQLEELPYSPEEKNYLIEERLGSMREHMLSGVFVQKEDVGEEDVASLVLQERTDYSLRTEKRMDVAVLDSMKSKLPGMTYDFATFESMD